ncbi:SusC/RagA family TonB-linked outer membrane protein [Pseudoflavitalea rhizosphaerae]|uniref:SusC/RagA family TonB-linked outer membrane protein n=1 Tax=Pseudoflavitalea rhizosphaerae TaxID=1884793 RepID=UPI001F498CD6|nr:SusC/RagA family TonB-linked outer membrane protein [Pseudoflavitalea rhizosphaerae]
MRQMLCRLVLCVIFGTLSCLTATAQEKKTVTGSVKDASGNPVASATIAEKGTTNQTASDNQGAFRIQVASGATIVISAVGFGTQELAVTDGPINVTLQTAAAGLDEVVVTALGIRRQKKSLGYAMQEVKGTALAEAREANVTNALSGRVAGLQIIRSGNGPGGSSKIVLRGNTSFKGTNQPLIVVDGIPVDNFTGVENNDYWNPQMDMGNGLSDINADDIESMSVLKGPAASALYGSRAGNGVILVTTKSGRKQSGLGISVGSTIGLESIFTSPKLQNSFAQGDNGIYQPQGSTGWGPKITGQEVTNWEGNKETLRAYDNLDAFFGTGVSNNENISFQQQYKNIGIYSSLNYFNDKSMLPGAKLTRTNFTLRATSKFGKEERWSTDAKVQYSNAQARNRPQSGINANNYASVMYMLPVSMDITGFKQDVLPNRKMRWYRTEDKSVNPYWNVRNRTNDDKRDRWIVNGSLKYEFTNWLNAEVKAGGDMYTTNQETRVYAGSPIVTNGSYSTNKQTYKEFNYSTLITARKDNLFGKLGGSATVGGNLMDQKWAQVGIETGELLVPDLFMASNGKGNPTLLDKVKDKKINSVYGSIGLNWDNYLFLEGTFRNDWTSTLHPDNRSYFYPSVSLSYIFTEHFNTPAWLTYGKIRGSVSSVGNDMAPYQLFNTYELGRDPNNNPITKRNKILFDSTVVNELITSTEVGAELRFFDNRFGIDFSYYNTVAKNQLIDLPMDPGSGYEKRRINAGKIKNTGFEISADARVLSSGSGLNWNIQANFSTNRNKVIDVYPRENVTRYDLATYDAVSVQAVAGALYGEIYGSTFLRVSDPKSADFGKLILDANGNPQRGEQNVRLGNQQPTALIGITNGFSYKNFNLSFLFDARLGGKVFSATNALLQRNGSAEVTVMNGDRAEFVADGVVTDGSGGYTKNTKATTPQRYWTAIGIGNLGITEANLYDASSIRIRNIQLSYDLPKKILGRTPIQRAKVGVSCNNVWLISSHLRGQDPEAVFATGNNANGFESFSPPTTRSILFNLSLSF